MLQTAEYAMDKLNVSRARLYGMVRENLLPLGVVVKLGRQLRFHPERLEQFIETGGAALPGGWKREGGEGKR